jgi:DNA-binding beta-propeller fold protein YncE
VIDTSSDALVRRVVLEGHTEPAQRVRCSPNGRYTVVTSCEAPLVTVLDAALASQVTLQVAQGPMGVGFHPDGRTALIGNHGAGQITVIDLEAGRVTDTFAAGVGVETLAFY